MRQRAFRYPPEQAVQLKSAFHPFRTLAVIRLSTQCGHRADDSDGPILSFGARNAKDRVRSQGDSLSGTLSLFATRLFAFQDFGQRGVGGCNSRKQRIVQRLEISILGKPQPLRHGLHLLDRSLG